ncbi:hypothetical protein GCM10008929_17480 [Alkalibacterium psychrotolerans]
MNEDQLKALEEMLRQKRENDERIGIKDVTRILYPSNSPETSTASQT